MSASGFEALEVLLYGYKGAKNVWGHEKEPEVERSDAAGAVEQRRQELAREIGGLKARPKKNQSRIERLEAQRQALADIKPEVQRADDEAFKKTEGNIKQDEAGRRQSERGSMIIEGAAMTAAQMAGIRKEKKVEAEIEELEEAKQGLKDANTSLKTRKADAEAQRDREALARRAAEADAGREAEARRAAEADAEREAEARRAAEADAEREAEARRAAEAEAQREARAREEAEARAREAEREVQEARRQAEAQRAKESQAHEAGAG